MPSIPFASSVALSGINSTAARSSEAFRDAFLRLPEMPRMVVMVSPSNALPRARDYLFRRLWKGSSAHALRQSHRRTHAPAKDFDTLAALHRLRGERRSALLTPTEHLPDGG